MRLFHSTTLNKYGREQAKEVTDIKEANLVGSKVEEGATFFTEDYHYIMLDIDASHEYRASSTSGHGHLIFEHPIPWEKYKNLLKVMAECGVCDPKWAALAIERGQAYLRLPHVKKVPAVLEALREMEVDLRR